MLTPQEVSEHAFAKASFGGYNMSMVDEFLDELTEDYSALYKENTALKAKMKVLVDTVEEYRSSEDAMRKALSAAQKVADNIVAEAEAKKASLLNDAEAAARERVDQLRQEISNEEARLSAARESAAAYMSKLRQLYQQELDRLDNLSGLAAAPPPPSDPIAAAAHEIEASMEKIIIQEQPSAVQEPEPERVPEPAGPAPAPAPAPFQPREDTLYAGGPRTPQADEPEIDEPTRRIDFDHLQFGKDYEIR